MLPLRGHSSTMWTEFFDPPSLCRQFLYSERGQKQTFLTPSPPHLVHVVIEWPLRLLGWPSALAVALKPEISLVVKV